MRVGGKDGSVSRFVGFFKVAVPSHPISWSNSATVPDWEQLCCFNPTQHARTSRLPFHTGKPPTHHSPSTQPPLPPPGDPHPRPPFPLVTTSQHPSIFRQIASTTTPFNPPTRPLPPPGDPWPARARRAGRVGPGWPHGPWRLPAIEGTPHGRHFPPGTMDAETCGYPLVSLGLAVEERTSFPLGVCR